MKKKYLQLFFAILFATNVMAQNIPNYVPSNGLVGWWPFNGNANDESGNGNHGTIRGATMTVDRKGNINSAIEMKSKQDLVCISNMMNSPNTFTYSVWFKSNSTEGGFLLGFDNGQCDHAGQWDRYILVEPTLIKYYTFPGQAVNTPFYMQLLDNQWHHIVVTMGQLVGSKIYIDGNLVSTNLNQKIGENYSGYFRLGGLSPESLSILGYYDDWGIWNRVLSAEEVKILYNSTIPCTPPTATITPKSSLDIKENTSVVLTATSGAGYNYTWYLDGNEIPNATDSIYSATKEGNYTVKISSAPDCQATSEAVTVKRLYTLPNNLPTNGLVGWWPFNGNANDESGNGNHGTVNGATLTADRNGKANSALGLDNLGDNISINNVSPAFNNFGISISAWLRLPNQYNYSTLAIVKNGVAYRNGFDLAIDQNNSAYGDNNYLVIFLVGDGTAVTFTTNHSEIGQWSHLVSTYDGNSIKIYLNGILKASKSFSSSLNCPNNELLFGKWDNDTPPSVTNRLVDDIAIYNRALTQEEITALYKGCTKETATSSSFNSLLFTNGNAFTIAAEPQGGVFTGATIENNQFIPSKAKIGSNAVKYNFKNSQGCADSTLFTMVVADTIGLSCSKYDTITVTNTITKYDTVVVPSSVITYDTITITKNITKYDTLTIKNNIYDTVTVNKTIYDTLTVKNNIYDTITVTNNVTKYDTIIVPKTVTTYDTVTITKNITIYDTLTIKNNVYDTVTVNKTIYDTLTIKNNIYDTITVTKNVTKYDTIIVPKTVTKYDTVTIKKNVYDTVVVNKTVTKYDTVTIKKNVYDTVIVPKTVTKYDTITIKNNVYDTVIVPKTITKYDTITIKNNVYDTVKINKTIYDTVIVPKTVTKYDTVTIKKNVYDTVIVPKTVTKYDTITIKNNVYDTVKINKTIYDTVLVNKTIYDTLTVKNNVYDTITMTDTVSVLKIKIKLTTGIYANQITSLSLYPNPTSDMLHIEVGNVTGLAGYRYRIVDALGKEVYNELVKNAITEIPLKTLGAAGMYQFEVLDQKNARIQTNKVVLQ